MKRLLQMFVLAAWLSLTQVVWAHGKAEHHEKKTADVVKEQMEWGIAGDEGKATRTINVGMSDAMRFTPEKIDVKAGETVKFVIKNDGKLLHEFVLGTKKTLDEHAALMAKFPEMEHDEPYMAHVGPGKTGEIVWTFNRPGQFDFACLIAGHYQAGMIGRISVLTK
ncbi:MAG TPA: cupredoxin family protein [Burkholderiales bacterium]|nr:cupredoxin family protein [Burkholderiales bacterium]